jgi:LAO/AO transport system kinase
MKAGLMEIADIFCVNKVDREGADRLIAILNRLISERVGSSDNSFPAVGTNGLTGDGADALAAAIADHRDYVTKSGLFQERRNQQLKAEVLDNVKNRIIEHLEQRVDIDQELEKISRELLSGKIDPYSAADDIYEQYFRRRLVND